MFKPRLSGLQLDLAYHGLALLCLACYQISAFAQFELPNTDLWQVQLSAGNIDLRQPPQALARTPAYENQPAYSNTGERIYFTQGDATGYTDIMVLELAQGLVQRLVQTTLSEFSPLPLPPGFTAEENFSEEGFVEESLAMVQVQADASQHLVLYTPNPQQTGTFVRISPSNAVGYHTWLIDHQGQLGSAQFIVTDPAALIFLPQVLQASPPNEHSTGQQEIALQVGRGLASRVDPRGVGSQLYFVQRSDSSTFLSVWRNGQAVPEALIALPEASEDFALAPDGSVWTGVGSRLYRWQPGTPRWALAAELKAYGIVEISRLAVHPQGHALVFVNTPNTN